MTGRNIPVKSQIVGKIIGKKHQACIPKKHEPEIPIFKHVEHVPFPCSYPLSVICYSFY